MATKVTGILGKKVGMTQLFDSKGDVRPVTVLQAGPCVVTQHKSATRDGYEAAQIGLVEFVKESRLTKPAQGHLAKNNLPPVKFMREVPLEMEAAVEGVEDKGVKVGDRVLVDMFDGERFVDIVGISKGRGFQGVVKRHHFAGGPKSHGSMFQITGSIGSSAFPSRVFKGMRMSGHMGNAARDAAQPARARRGQGRELAGRRGQRAGAGGWIHHYYEGEEAATRAAWVCGFGDGGSVEGCEASGEEGIGAVGGQLASGRWPTQDESIWQLSIYTI